MRFLTDEILQELLDKYGEQEQLWQAVGECGELIAVIQNYNRAKKYGHRTEELADVMKEAADVWFMVQQIRAMDRLMFDKCCELQETRIFRKIDNEKIKGTKK